MKPTKRTFITGIPVRHHRHIQMAHECRLSDTLVTRYQLTCQLCALTLPRWFEEPFAPVITGYFSTLMAFYVIWSIRSSTYLKKRSGIASFLMLGWMIPRALKEPFSPHFVLPDVDKSSLSQILRTVIKTSSNEQSRGQKHQKTSAFYNAC